MMKNFGFLRVAAAVPVVKVASVSHNVNEICRLAEEAAAKEVSVIVFPELSVTGCSCGDLFYQSHLVREAETGVGAIAEFSMGKDTVLVVGAPVPVNGRLYDCAVVIRDGEIMAIVPKTCISGVQRRWFTSGSGISSESEITYAGQTCAFSQSLLLHLGDARMAVEFGDEISTPLTPSAYHTLAGAQVVMNLSSCNELVMSDRRRKSTLTDLSARNICAYIYASAGFGESSQDLVYGGAACIFENGEMIAENERFCTCGSLTVADIDIEKLDLLRRKTDDDTRAIVGSEYDVIDLGDACQTDFSTSLCRNIEANPFLPAGEEDYRCREVISLQTAALMTRLNHIGCRSAIIGISGGLDSTLALLVAVMAFDRLGWSRERIIGVTMPGFGTTSRTKNNAWDLMQTLGITCREISIKAACEQHFADINHDASVHDATYENSQARERTQILMDLANKEGGIVIGTGDLSELALGWATYNGDHMSMYGVNADIPKTLVKSLVRWIAENKFTEASGERSVKEILMDIVDTPISPELLPANDKGEILQVTEDLVGPYELHDFFIYNFMRNGYSPEKILFLAKKAFSCHPEEQGDVRISTYDEETIIKWLRTFIRRFFNQQFKRSCLPDGHAIGSVSLSPRGAWTMPSDAWSTMFSNDIN
jgi:NAD+ synthase (glutamine-hydrolysing)